jgi:NDP-sugar pyrophosphorylase family protein
VYGIEKVKMRTRRLEDSPSDLEQVSVAILAGGMGTRLRAVVVDRPKVLARVHGRPYLAYLLDRLATAGTAEVVLLTGYRAEQVFDTFGERYAGMRLIHSPEAKPLGTGGALRHALPKLRSTEVLVQNGDSWCDVDLADFLKFHRFNEAELSMVLAKTTDVSRFGQVQVGDGDRVVCFKEKAEGGFGWINAGAYLLGRRLVGEIAARKPISLECDVIPRWIQEGRKVFAYRHEGQFLDIGTPESYAAAEKLIPNRRPAACGLALTQDPARARSRKRREGKIMS